MMCWALASMSRIVASEDAGVMPRGQQGTTLIFIDFPETRARDVKHVTNELTKQRAYARSTNTQGNARHKAQAPQHP